MSELTINRRQAVRTAAGVAAGSVLVAGAGVGAAAANDHSSGLVGSWVVTHRNNKPAPPEVGKAIVSFIAGGVIVANEFDPVGAVESGSWASRGNNRFVATLWSGFEAEGKNPAGTVRIQVSGRRSGDKVSGTFKVTVYPKKGKSESVSGTFSGTRLDAD
jgi:hypothetical protein